MAILTEKSNVLFNWIEIKLICNSWLALATPSVEWGSAFPQNQGGPWQLEDGHEQDLRIVQQQRGGHGRKGEWRGEGGAKGGHTIVVSYLLNYPNNILSVPTPDMSQLTPTSHDTSQVDCWLACRQTSTITNMLFVWMTCWYQIILLCYLTLYLTQTGSTSSIPSPGHGGASSRARQGPL